MEDYKSLYHLMVNASEDALAAIAAQNYGQAAQILQSAELTAEERILAANEQIRGT